MGIKKIVYKTASYCMRSLWRFRGCRTIRAFNEEFNVTAETLFPDYRKFRLPKKGCLSEIVRYADYVQLHSIVRHVSELKGQVVLIDVGAHHGAYAIIFGKMVQNRGGKVIAIEPNPESFEILRKNVQLNNLQDTVICECVAAGEIAGRKGLKAKGRQSHLEENRSAESRSVDVVTLSELLDQYEITDVALLMIDVEGAELKVLRGFPWDAVKVKLVFCELHPYAWKDFGYNGIDMKEFIDFRGYRCFDMYLKEYATFVNEGYIGPTMFIPKVI